MRGIAAIDKKTSAVSSQGDDVVAGSGDQRDFVGEFGCGGGCVGVCGPGESERGGAGSESLEKFTALRVHTVDIVSPDLVLESRQLLQRNAQDWRRTAPFAL